MGFVLEVVVYDTVLHTECLRSLTTSLSIWMGLMRVRVGLGRREWCVIDDDEDELLTRC